MPVSSERVVRVRQVARAWPEVLAQLDFRLSRQAAERAVDTQLLIQPSKAEVGGMLVGSPLAAPEESLVFRERPLGELLLLTRDFLVVEEEELPPQPVLVQQEECTEEVGVVEATH